MPILSNFPGGGYGPGDTLSGSQITVTQPDGSPVWAATSIASNAAQACVADSTCGYVGGDTYLKAYNLATGVAIWTITTVYVSSLFVDENYLYATTTVNPNPKIYKINKSTGAIIWSVAISGPSKICAESNYVYYTSQGYGTIGALNQSDGSTKWSYSLTSACYICVAAGIVYVLQNVNNSAFLYKLTYSSGTTPSAEISSLSFSYPRSITADGTNLYIACGGGFGIYQIPISNISTKIQQTVFGDVVGNMKSDGTYLYFLQGLYTNSQSGVAVAFACKCDITAFSTGVRFVWVSEYVGNGSGMGIGVNSDYVFVSYVPSSNINPAVICYHNKAAYSITA